VLARDSRALLGRNPAATALAVTALAVAIAVILALIG
jgi:hypothetical protein